MTKIPWIDAVLTLIIAIGAFNVWQTAAQRAELQPEYQRLKLLTGELIAKDPSKIYVRAIPTDDPLEFAWRVHFPPNYRLNVQYTTGSSSGGSNSQAVNAIVRVRLREENGSWRVYERFPFSSGLSSVDPRAAAFLSKHPDQILVEQLGKDSVEELDVNSHFTLLDVRVPRDAVKEASGSFSGEIIRVSVGPSR